MQALKTGATYEHADHHCTYNRTLSLFPEYCNTMSKPCCAVSHKSEMWLQQPAISTRKKILHLLTSEEEGDFVPAPVPSLLLPSLVLCCAGLFGSLTAPLLLEAAALDVNLMKST